MFPVSSPPREPAAQWAHREFIRLRDYLAASDLMTLQPTTVAPEKPRLGDIRLADGVNWNPGGGAGVYCYYGSTWNRLG